MSKQDPKPYSGQRWTDVPKAYVIGHREISEEEVQEKSRDFYEFIERETGRQKKK